MPWLVCVCLHGVPAVAVCGTVGLWQAAQLAVSLLQPDVATLISRGDTLLYGLHGRDAARAEPLRRTLDGLRARWHALKSHMEVSRAGGAGRRGMTDRGAGWGGERDLTDRAGDRR